MMNSHSPVSSTPVTIFDKDSDSFQKWSRRLISTIFIMMLAVVFLASCVTETAPAVLNIPDNGVIVDVRTAEEYATGHLTGAKLLDLNSGDFAKALPTLDPDAEYFVYCRSGSRSAQAVNMMEEAGFGNVTDLGSVEQASELTGVEIVEIVE